MEKEIFVDNDKKKYLRSFEANVLLNITKNARVNTRK